MSESDKDASNVGGEDRVGCGNEGGEDEEDGDVDDGIGTGIERKKQKTQRHGRGIRRATRAIFLSPLGRAKKRLLPYRGNAGGRRFGGGGGCYLCLTRPQTMESPAESPGSDPNSPEFTYELLKALIENNDFYSKDCNPHLIVN
ncbi:uncharacterized protein LOC131154427 [Malania oleifera]|uniref:uncharacterized protein LOC131154427 n=1 Tax=Malania oleifera TaxID=397392 RepID=UPI0025ADE0B3|nr:uncharacterized protein LOC131154427 [Malania oleifera]